MTDIRFYQVDAFTGNVFGGNPAGVCPLAEELPDELMQKIAAENNLSETAFIFSREGRLHIRWFTPKPRSTSADTQPSPPPMSCSTTRASQGRFWSSSRKAAL